MEAFKDALNVSFGNANARIGHRQNPLWLLFSLELEGHFNVRWCISPVANGVVQQVAQYPVQMGAVSKEAVCTERVIFGQSDVELATELLDLRKEGVRALLNPGHSGKCSFADLVGRFSQCRHTHDFFDLPLHSVVFCQDQMEVAAA